MVQEGGGPFVQDLAVLAETVGPLPDSKAQAFLQAWPLDAVFRWGGRVAGGRRGGGGAGAARAPSQALLLLAAGS